MIKKVFLPIAATIIFIVIVGLMYQGKIKLPTKDGVEVSKPETKIIRIGLTKITAEIADTKEERAVGLSNRESLDKNSGMLFIFEEKDVQPVFWMKDTKIPLDIIWIDDGKITQIDKNVQTELEKEEKDLTLYQSESVIDYVLEVNSGYFDKNKIKVGQKISGL